MSSSSKRTIVVIMQGEDSVHEKQSEANSPPPNSPAIWDQFKSSVEETGIARVLFLKDRVKMELNAGSYMQQFQQLLDEEQPDWLVAFFTHEHRYAGTTGNLFLELGYYVSRYSDRRYTLISRPTVLIPDLATCMGVHQLSTAKEAATHVLDSMSKGLSS